MPAWLPAAISGGSALIGALMSHLGKSKEAQTRQFPRYTPEQSGVLSQLLQQGLQNINPEAIQQQAMGRFTSDVMPSIAARFASMGGAGAQRSSAFPAALAGAGAEMQGNIAAMMPQLGLQQLMMGLQPQFETMYEPERMGGMQSAGQGIMQGGLSDLGPSLRMWLNQGTQNKQSKAISDLLAFLKQQAGGAPRQEQVNPLPAMPQPAATGYSPINALPPYLASLLQGGM